jgi:glycosyltransferase 2 family protein
MSDNTDNLLRKIRPAKVIYPIGIGLIVVAFLIYRDWNPEIFSKLDFSWFSVYFLLLAFIMMAIRDIGYMARVKILSDNDLTWKKAFNVIILWEFASALMPSLVGGTAVAFIFIWKEGITLGRSTAIVLATAILDELYFIIMFPLLLLIISSHDLFAVHDNQAGISFTNQFFYFAIIGFIIKFLFIIVVAYGLFINPKGIKWIIVKTFTLPILRRWIKGAVKTGDDIVTSSDELKSKTFKFWFNAFIATFFSWTARFWIINFLILSLLYGIPNNAGIFGFGEHFLIFARQVTMWIMMLVMPSPGGSGFAEVVFSDYMRIFIPVGFVSVMALLWRLVSYYPYLLIGSFVLPRWIKKVSKKKQPAKD